MSFSDEKARGIIELTESVMTLFTAHPYSPLILWEIEAIDRYLDTGNRDELIEILAGDRPLSAGMRKFMADVWCCKVSAQKDRLKVAKRIEKLGRRTCIALNILAAEFCGAPLRSTNRTGIDGAAALAAEKYGKEGQDPEEAAIRAYSRNKAIKTLKQAIRPVKDKKPP